jgi:Tat protein translocase TatB subunit
MLDFGFSEILLTSAIALVVLGPERLPKVARQVGNWMGRARSMARQLSEQLEREVSAEELIREQNKSKPPVMTPIAAPAVVPLTPTASHAEAVPLVVAEPLVGGEPVAVAARPDSHSPAVDTVKSSNE